MSDNVKLSMNFQKLADIAQKTVRRSAAFLAVGRKAWADEAFHSAKIDMPMGIQFLPDPLPTGLAKEIQATFRVWICGAILAELVQGLSAFADEYYWAGQHILLHKKKMTDEVLTSIARVRKDTNLASKIRAIQEDIGVKCGLMQHVESWSLARNAHAHNHGILRERDCDYGKRTLTVTWRQFEMVAGDKVLPDPIGYQVKEGERLDIRLGFGAKEFVVGRSVEFTESEMLRLCLTAHLHSNNMVTALDEKLKSIIAANGSKDNPAEAGPSSP